MTALPQYIDPEMFAAFVEMRQALKGIPFTPRAQLLIVKKLMRLHGEGYCPNSALEASVISGWRDVFPKDRIAKEQNDKDPALVKLERDRQMATPMPAFVRDFGSKLKAQV